MSIRVALADDQALVREGLKALLRDLQFDVSIEAADAATLLALLEESSPDVIVSDIRMPGMSGIELTRELRNRGVRIPVVLLTTFDDRDLLPAAVNAGAQAFLLKDASPEELSAAITHVSRGQQWLAPVASNTVLKGAVTSDQAAPSFSERELSVLRLLAGGYSNKEVARTLNLAEGTVKNYVSDILLKLNTPDRTRAVLKAISLRII